MHEKHASRAADRASAMAATADIVGGEHFTAAASVLLPIAGFDLKCAGKHDEQLTPRGRVPVLIRGLQASPSPLCFAPAERLTGGRYCRKRRSTHCRSAYRPRQIAIHHRVQKQSERLSSGFSG